MLINRSDVFINRCKEAIVDYYNNRVDVTDDKKIAIDEIYVVWYCRTLQNHKALLSTVVPDGMYYELTLNGDEGKLYLDAYKKWENVEFLITRGD